MDSNINSRKEIYNNHGHFKNPQPIGERHSYNYSDARKRQADNTNPRHRTPNSSNFGNRNNKNSTSYDNQNKANMTSNAKQKIKNLLSGGNTGVFSVNNHSNNYDENYGPDKRKAAKLITGNSNDPIKKMHKKSNSMKNDLLQKYYGKHNHNNSNSVDMNPNNQTEIINKNNSGIQRIGSHQKNPSTEELVNHSHQQVHLSGNNLPKGSHIKTQSLITNNMLGNNVELEKT